MDTITLSIPFGSYLVTNKLKFKPYFQPINPGNIDERTSFIQEEKGYKKYKHVDYSSYRKQGLVYPHLRIDESLKGNNYSLDLKITFSCPKLIWGHSFEEVDDNHFPEIITTLKDKLLDMCVLISEDALSNAIVHTLHYSKNIKFPSQNEARIFLNRLSKVSFNAWFENNAKTYSNDGKAVRFHTDTFEIVFYLKYYDVLETGNRSVGRNTTKQEKEIAKKHLKEGNIPPVVRIELRFNGKRSVCNHLKTSLGIEKQNWKFKEVYNIQRCLNTLIYYWNKIISDPINRTYLSETSDEDICEKLLSQFSEEATRKIFIEGAGLFYFIKTLGVTRFKSTVFEKQNYKAWFDKRKKFIKFAQQFIEPDESLIKIVTDVLEN